MNTKIETYRGHDILFETETERFTFSLDSGSYSEKQSYAACKKAIDDFIKENEKFEPFDVVTKYGKKVTILNIRKDKRFNSSNGQISEGYGEKEYLLYDEKFEPIFEQINNLQKEIESLQLKYRSLADSITGKTLFDYKKENFGE